MAEVARVVRLAVVLLSNLGLGEHGVDVLHAMMSDVTQRH
jgi:hypothetical protein